MAHEVERVAVLRYDEVADIGRHRCDADLTVRDAFKLDIDSLCLVFPVGLFIILLILFLIVFLVGFAFFFGFLQFGFLFVVQLAVFLGEHEAVHGVLIHEHEVNVAHGAP